MAEVRRRLGDYLYADDDRSLTQVLLDALRERGLTIGIAEAGTGGRFGCLLLCKPSAADVVRGTVAGASSHSSETASDLAHSARAQFGASVGVGINATAAPTTQGLFEGDVDVAVFGECEREESFPIRRRFRRFSGEPQ